MKFKLLIAAAVLLPLTSQAQIGVWMSPPDVETANSPGISVPGAITETFNSLSHGSSPDGLRDNGATYSTSVSAPSVALPTARTNDAFGGTSTGRYLGGPQRTNTTLTLSTPAAYFGIYITAADAFNEVVISNLGSTILTFDAATLLSRLAGPTVTAINGTPYATADYYGKPVSGTNPSQAYAYVHFIADVGITFDKIELKQKPGTATFESDNQTISNTHIAVLPGGLIAVPEPSSLLLSMATLGGLLLVRKRK